MTLQELDSKMRDYPPSGSTRGPKTIPAILIPSPPEKPEIGPIPPDRVASFLAEFLRSYAFADFDPPAEEILVGMSLEAADAIIVPDSWIPRLFAVARKEYRPIPKLKDLSDCFRDHIKEEIREAYSRERIAKTAKLPPPPAPSPEEEFETMKEFFIKIAGIGVELSEETRKKYGI